MGTITAVGSPASLETIWMSVSGTASVYPLRLQLNYDLARIQARSGKIHVRRLGTPAQLAL
jgi:hypothetical protein